jgi:two-component system, chemotaxis family, chemotaxis protein CheY
MPTTKPMRRPLILAVDDAKAVRTIIENVLTPFDCNVEGASNGYNALFKMETALPDLIVLDVNMPIMGGLEMLEMLKSKPELAGIPVIILASPADHAVLPKLKELGLAGLLMKPFEPAALLTAIRSIITIKPAKA